MNPATGKRTVGGITRPIPGGHFSVTLEGYLVSMRYTNGNQIERPPRGPAADTVVALLIAAGLQAERVERCPEPSCPLCAGGSRAAA